MDSSKNFKALLSSIPSSIAIIVQESIVILLLLFGPLESNSIWPLIVWVILDSASGFIYGKISDLRCRKSVLIFSQGVGVIIGLVLVFFGFTVWAMLVVGVTYNPTPVCRAAFLDNFPSFSPLRVLGTTYVISSLPQFGYTLFSFFEPKFLTYVLLITSLINLPLMIFLFHDDFDGTFTDSNNRPEHSLKAVLFKGIIPRLLLIAFFLAETPFNIMWDFLDLNLDTRNWFPIITSGTIFGILLSMWITKKLPHKTTITLIYSAGIAFPLLAFWIHISNILPMTIEQLLLIYTVFACVFGGLYLPLVADAIIGKLGIHNRGVGAALIEIIDTVSSSVTAPIVTGFLKPHYLILLPLFSGIYLFATICQSKSK